MAFSVLTIDDDVAIQQVLSVLIDVEERMVPTAPAYDGAEGLRRLEEGCPDVIICDVNMPGLSGLQVLPLLRERCPAAVIALYSAHPMARRGTQLGADAVFDKSSDDPSEMLAELLRLCEAGPAQS